MSSGNVLPHSSYAKIVAQANAVISSKHKRSLNHVAAHQAKAKERAEALARFETLIEGGLGTALAELSKMPIGTGTTSMTALLSNPSTYHTGKPSETVEFLIKAAISEISAYLVYNKEAVSSLQLYSLFLVQNVLHSLRSDTLEQDIKSGIIFKL